MKYLSAPVILGLVIASALTMTACTKHEVAIKPIEIKPIKISIDVNVRVDKALDDFFGDLDEDTSS